MPQEHNEQQAWLEDYQESWKKLFVSEPDTGWYWHVMSHEPMYIYKHQHIWHCLTIDVKNNATTSGQLMPGVYELLIRIEKYVP